ncbi:MAG: formate dehydrogenase [Massilia sp.]|nr:formate dehydrogenase [Massilia sp.]MDB5949146.1 formate dehydrogenase [Massilia sp.]
MDKRMDKHKHKDKDQSVDPKRRGFLRAAGGAGALGALAAVAGQATAATPAAAPATAEPAASVGYHETEHIRQYYRTARYW